MGRKKTDPKIEGEVRGLLKAGCSEWLIIKDFKKRDITIGKGTINRIKRRINKSSPIKENKRPKGVDFKKLDPRK